MHIYIVTMFQEAEVRTKAMDNLHYRLTFDLGNE